jgi:hypothetical protein
MRHAFFPVVIVLLCACSTIPRSSRPGSSQFIDLSGISFTAESVKGQVQIKENRNTPWHDLAPGERFNGYALIRSGFRSGAFLVMDDGARRLEFMVDDLLCGVSFNDIYDRVLCPAGLHRYHLAQWDSEEPLENETVIKVCRESMGYTTGGSGLLMTASLDVVNRSQQLGAGAGAGGCSS